MPHQNVDDNEKQRAVLEELTKASAGLEYPSESDAPFDAFVWRSAPSNSAPKPRAEAVGDATGPSARQQVAARTGAKRTIEPVPVDQFFKELEASEDGPRYRALRQLLTSRLSNLQVFRAG